MIKRYDIDVWGGDMPYLSKEECKDGDWFKVEDLSGLLLDLRHLHQCLHTWTEAETCQELAKILEINKELWSEE